MIRSAILVLVALGAVVAGVAWFSDRPGTVSVEWQGWLVEMSAGRFVLLCIVVAAVIVVGTATVRAIWNVPEMIRESFRASRRDRGYRALTQGMVAVAAGASDEALRLARRADALLDDPPLTMLLSAQAAQLNGEEEAARNYFLEMLGQPELAFLGLRGLLMQAQRGGDRATALEYARKAYDLRAGTPWVLSTLFELRVERNEWSEALAILDEAEKRQIALPDAEDCARAAVLMGCSSEAEAAGRLSRALRYARRAHALVPRFTPAVLRIVELLVRSGSAGRADRMIRDAWTEAPHPELARVFGEIGTDSDPLKVVRRLEELLAANPDHQESHVALAKAALEARLWGEARNHLNTVAEHDPPARVCRLMAELEEREHGDTGSMRSWLFKASSAVPDSAWVCGGCGNAWERWTPVCGNCGSLGTQEWRPPARPGSLGDAGAGDGGDLRLGVRNAGLAERPALSETRQG